MATNDLNEKNNNLLYPVSGEHSNPPHRPQSGASAVSSNPTVNEKRISSAGTQRTHSRSVSSNVNTVASSGRSVSAENRDKQRAVRTLPPWVQTVEDDDDFLKPPTSQPRTPPTIRPASHHYIPQPREGAPAGRIFDHERERTPVTITTPVADHASKWAAFIKASTYGGPANQQGEIVDGAWMKENLPDLEQPWEPEPIPEGEENEAGFWLLNPRKRKTRMKKWQRAVMRDPRVPAVFRAWVLVMSVIALGLSGSIFRKTGQKDVQTESCGRGSSTYMAIIVDVIAIPYTFYVTYDEYINKPLGLRSHGAKMRLIFLDLVFIVFDSANLSVAFESLTDPRWVCREADHIDNNTCQRDDNICNRQIALTVILLVALLAWISTFAISTLRIIERAINR